MCSVLSILTWVENISTLKPKRLEQVEWTILRERERERERERTTKYTLNKDFNKKRHCTYIIIGLNYKNTKFIYLLKVVSSNQKIKENKLKK